LAETGYRLNFVAMLLWEIEMEWLMKITRVSEQRRSSDNKRRTVGRYQVFHDGVVQSGADLSGTTAESRGPGANEPAGNGRRVEAGRYQLATQAGTKYVTLNYTSSQNQASLPRPGIELLETGKRSEILIHPGIGFLASIGCINLCASLPNASEMITFPSSRRRVISVIDDLRTFIGSNFPGQNGRKIPNAFVVIEGEPTI
jgi:hypothetical protein